MKLIYSLLLALAMTTRFAYADDALQATLEAHKVTRQTDGKEALAPAGEAQPGDVVEYRSIYRNVSAKTLTKVAATLPIPAGFEYIENTATARALASTDGKSFAPVPLMRVVKTAQGKNEMRPVPAAEYRYLRWSLGDMRAGTTSTVVARVRMSSGPVQAADR